MRVHIKVRGKIYGEYHPNQQVVYTKHPAFNVRLTAYAANSLADAKRIILGTVRINPKSMQDVSCCL